MLQLLPEKHVRLNETFLGLGACVLESLQSAKTLDTLWEDIREIKNKKKTLPPKVSFEDLVMAVDFLFAIKAVKKNEDGSVLRCA